MRTSIRTFVVFTLAAASFAGCTRVQAKQALREGHRLYKEESYRKATEQYKFVIENDPAAVEALFYLGSSFHQLYRPGKEESKVNLDQAIANYKAVLDQSGSQDPNYGVLRRNALSALIGIYADAPFNDFDTSKKYADELTRDNPNELTNVFAMAGLYEKFGKVPEAEAEYTKAAQSNPNDPKACGALAGFYNKPLWNDKGEVVAQGGVAKFTAAVSQLEKCADLTPSDAKGFYTVSTYYWDKVYRGCALCPDGEKNRLVERGMEFVDKALGINEAFVEALVYKGLLLRERAKLTMNPARRNELIEQAKALQDRALALKKQQEQEQAERARQAAAAAVS